jgi:anti-sigma B factor antagonist
MKKSYSITEKNNVFVVLFPDKLGRENVTDVNLIVDELNAQNALNVVLDFKNVDYIFSAVLGKLILYLKKIRESGGEIKISGMNNTVKSIFEVTRLDSIFDLFDTLDDAMKSFK